MVFFCKDCDKRASFNFDGEKFPLYCDSHKSEGMIDIVNKRCVCDGCPLYAIYNYDGSNSRLFCERHKISGMVKIELHDLCIKCGVRSSFNYKNSRKGIYCKYHKLNGMINVCKRRCSYNDSCDKKPLFNFIGLKKRLYCSDHKLEGMIDLTTTNKIALTSFTNHEQDTFAKLKCEFEGCEKMPSFNFLGTTMSRFCRAHKLEGMINVRIYSSKCHYEGCDKRPHYNYDKAFYGIYCASHKLRNMVRIHGSRYEFYKTKGFANPKGLNKNKKSNENIEKITNNENVNTIVSYAVDESIPEKFNFETEQISYYENSV